MWGTAKYCTQHAFINEKQNRGNWLQRHLDFTSWKYNECRMDSAVETAVEPISMSGMAVMNEHQHIIKHARLNWRSYNMPLSQQIFWLVGEVLLTMAWLVTSQNSKISTPCNWSSSIKLSIIYLFISSFYGEKDLSINRSVLGEKTFNSKTQGWHIMYTYTCNLITKKVGRLHKIVDRNRMWTSAKYWHPKHILKQHKDNILNTETEELNFLKQD